MDPPPPLGSGPGRQPPVDALDKRKIVLWLLRTDCSGLCVCVCVCVCVICTFRGGSLCSVGLDASFGSGLLRPLRDVVSLPSAESEPLYFAG